MPQATVTTSKKFNLNLSDWTRGLLVAVITGPVTIIIQSLNEGTLTFNWKTIATVGLSAGLSYILKNWLLTPNEITIKNAPTEKLESVKNGESIVKVVEK